MSELEEAARRFAAAIVKAGDADIGPATIVPLVVGVFKQEGLELPALPGLPS